MFPVFKDFKAQVELEFRNKIKCLRIDNEKEYTNDKFLVLCKQEGIERQFNVPYTPQ